MEYWNIGSFLHRIEINPGCDFRCHHLAWTNGCDTLSVVGLHENWTWSNSGIQGLRNLGIEEILSILIY